MSKAEKYVQHIIENVQKDNRARGCLRKADNPNTIHYAWEYINSWCNIENPESYMPYAVIGAAIATTKPKKDGGLSLGQAIALCYEKGSEAEPAKARLRRLLGCRNKVEVCKHIKSVIRLIQSKGLPISYSRLLNELYYFDKDKRARWANQFYRKAEKNDSVDV